MTIKTKKLNLRNSVAPMTSMNLEEGKFHYEDNILLNNEIRNRIVQQMQKQKRFDVYDCAQCNTDFLIQFEYKGKTVLLQGGVIDDSRYGTFPHEIDDLNPKLLKECA